MLSALWPLSWIDALSIILSTKPRDCMGRTSTNWPILYWVRRKTLTQSRHHHNHNRFMAPFLGQPGWAGARRELLDLMVQGKINRGRHTDHPPGCHSIWTNQWPPPPSPHIFYGPDSLPAAQPTVPKHWRQLAHSDILIREKMLEFSMVLPAP